MNVNIFLIKIVRMVRKYLIFSFFINDFHIGTITGSIV